MTTEKKERGKLKKGWITAGIIFTIVLISASVPVWYEYEKPVHETQLPEEALHFIKTAYPGTGIAFSKLEFEDYALSYEVILSNGAKLSFRKNGEWTEIKCRKFGIPETVLPEEAISRLKESGISGRITEAKKEGRDFEIEIERESGESMEITFDSKNFTLKDMDF